MVSIIVPVYNVEKCLGYCISSILNQTYQDIELILVNDGSTDQSLRICCNYRELDSRIKIIDIPNGGVGNARNKGIEESKGEYLLFVDSDDYIASDMVENLFHKAQLYNKDIVICGMNIVELSGKNVKQIKQYSFDAIGNEVVYDHMLFVEKLPVLVWKSALMEGPCNRIYNADIIRKNQLKFPTDTQYGEDFLFNLTYYSKCNGAVLLNKPYYYYIFTNEDSLSQKYKKNLFQNQMRLMQAFKSMLIEQNVWKKADKISFYNYVVGHTLNSVQMLYHKDAGFDDEQIKGELAVICNDGLVRKSIKNVDYIPEGTRHILNEIMKCDVDGVWWHGKKWFVEGVDIEKLEKEEEERRKEELEKRNASQPNPGLLNKGIRWCLRLLNKFLRFEKISSIEKSIYEKGLKNVIIMR